jgi:hypothetical protein
VGEVVTTRRVATGAWFFGSQAEPIAAAAIARLRTALSVRVVEGVSMARVSLFSGMSSEKKPYLFAGDSALA